MKKIFLLILFSLQTNARAGESIAFIVNNSNSVMELSAVDILDYYMKKKRVWPNGTSVRFIDRGDDSPERSFFLKNFLKQSGRDVELYWIGQKLATGNSAPLQASSDSLVEVLVSRFPGAIGYVSGGFTPSTGAVKKIQVTGIQ